MTQTLWELFTFAAMEHSTHPSYQFATHIGSNMFLKCASISVNLNEAQRQCEGGSAQLSPTLNNAQCGAKWVSSAYFDLSGRYILKALIQL